jgi:hypothetical protein
MRAVTVAFVPEAAALAENEWRAADAIIAKALDARPASQRRQIAAFLRLLDLLSLVRHRRSVARLSVAERTELLEALSRSRLLLLRRGVWGIRTLAFMGFYARPEGAQEIGYRASASGWSSRQVAPP